MIDSLASRTKRAVEDEGLTQAEWRTRVQRAVVRDSSVRKLDENIRVKTPMDFCLPHQQAVVGCLKDG